MDLSRYLKIGLHWWWLVLLSVVISATASYIYSQRLPKIYAAKASLLVGTSVIQTLNPNQNTLGLSRTLAEVYGELAHRKLVTQAVIDKLGLDITPDQLGEMIQTNVIPSAQLLEIFILDVYPERAQLLANTIAEELILQSPTGSLDQKNREQFIKTQLEELQTKISDANQKITKLEDSLGGMTSAVEISEAQSQLTQLEKLKADYQTNYNQFLSNLGESAPNKLTIFELATEPTIPVSPNVKMNVLIAAVAGLVLALSAIILMEFFDDTLVWQGEETRFVLGFPVIGAISKVKASDSKIISGDKLWSPEADTLRALRSSVFLVSPGQKLSTLLVTSSVPNEGKSFLAANLAAVIASTGSSVAAVVALASTATKVILIDADLRKPYLHEVFDMPNLLGLADVLATPEVSVEALLKKALRPTHIDSLLLLPAGRSPMDPGHLLNSPQFIEVLRFLKTQADLIIIDSAPLLAAAETKFVANAVDATLLVIRDGRTRQKLARKAIDYFQGENKRKLIGLVFNRVKLLSGYDYYRTYNYGSRTQSVEKSEYLPAFLRKIWPFAQNQHSESEILTLAEAADYLGISENAARRWCEEGRLPAIKKHQRWLVRLETLNKFIASYQNESAPGQGRANGKGINSNSDSQPAEIDWEHETFEV